MENKRKNSIIAGVIALLGMLGEAGRRKTRTNAQKKREKKAKEKWDDTQLILFEETDMEVSILDKNTELPNLEMSETEKDNQEDLKTFISTAIGQLGQTYNNVQAFDGVLKCDVPISWLVKCNSGELRGMIIKDGKITRHAKFQEAGFKAATPLIAFQAMSMITGQYYQHVITEQLDKIGGKVDKLLQRDDIRNGESEYKLAYKKLKEYSVQDEYIELDLSKLENISDKMYKLAEDYHSFCQNTDITICYGNTDYEEAKKKIEKLESEHFFYNHTMALEAEVLYYISNVLLLKAAISLKKPDDVINKYKNRINPSFWVKHRENYSKIKSEMMHYLDLAAETSIFGKKNIKQLKDKLEKQFQTSIEQFKETQAELNKRVQIYLAINPEGKVVQCTLKE